MTRIKASLKTTTWPCPGSSECPSRGSCCVRSSTTRSTRQVLLLFVRLSSPSNSKYVITSYFLLLFVCLFLYLLNTGPCVPWHSPHFSWAGTAPTMLFLFTPVWCLLARNQPVLRLARISAAFSNFAPLFLNPSALKA